MTGCGCEEARANLEEVIRGELCAEESAPIREHLAECPECRSEEQACQRLTEAVQRACAEEREGEAPPSLREAVLSGLRDLHGEKG